MSKQPFSPIEQAFEDLRQGKFIILLDDEDRENEGDLVIAAPMATPETVNFMPSDRQKGALETPKQRKKIDRYGRRNCWIERGDHARIIAWLFGRKEIWDRSEHPSHRIVWNPGSEAY